MMNGEKKKPGRKKMKVLIDKETIESVMLYTFFLIVSTRDSRKCDDCGKLISIEEIEVAYKIKSNEKVKVCLQCFETNYRKCPSCMEYYDRLLLDDMCEECHEEEEND